MKNIIAGLADDKAKKVLTDFCNVYFDKGFGLMNKTEIETLIYNVLLENGLLNGKCFNDSCVLKIPETKARKLNYDSKIKYKMFNNDADRDKYLREEIGKRLQNAVLVKSGTQIQFVIDDKYLHVALNAKLRDNNILTDTSFNKDIVSVDANSFINMLSLLVPNVTFDKIREKFVNFSDEPDKTLWQNFKSFFDSLGDNAGNINSLLELGKVLLPVV